MDQSLLLELVVTGAGDLTTVDTVRMLVFCAYQKQVNKLKLFETCPGPNVMKLL